MRTSGHGWGRDGTGRRATHPWAQRDPGLGSLTPPSHSEELCHTWVSWPGSSAACSDPTPRRRGSGLHSRPRATASSRHVAQRDLMDGVLAFGEQRRGEGSWPDMPWAGG